MMSNMIQNQSMLPSFMKIEEDETMVKLKQGIVTILTPSSASSLRRTLSADMSSKKWMHDLQQQEEKHNQDSFKMKKIASSAELTHSLPNNSFSSSSSSCSDEGEEEEKEEEEEEAERERLAIWSSILKNKKEEQEKSKGGFDTWGSIMSMKSDSDSNSNSNSKNNQSLEMTKSLPVSVTVTPYVHPLVKRSKSSLSDKSLEICTESLGSETGSDSLLFSSSSSPSFPSGESEKVVKESEQEEKEEENNHVAAITKSKLLSHPRCFPPPLPSLSFHGCNKSKEDSSSSSSSSLHMKPHRDNGRLVLQAVSLPSNNNFNAQRQDGRLVLTFANDQEVPEVEDDDEEEEEEEEEEENYDDEGMEEEEEFEEEEEEEVFEEENDEEEEEEEEDESEVVMEKKAPLMSSGITTTTTVNSGGGNLHRLTLMMNNNNNNNKKTIGLVNRNMNPNWSVDKFNKKGMNMNLEDVNVSVVARLIPSSAGSATSPPPPSSFNLNAYEYFWKTPKPSSKLPNNNNNNNEQHQQLLVLRGKNGDYLVHNFKGCKDSRRSLLFWEPYCIATS